MENHASENKHLEQDDILALDVASHCGYFSRHGAGTWNLTESLRRNDNKMHGSFRTLLIDFIQKYGIKQIVAEDVSMNRHFYDLRRLSELRGVLLEVCDELNLPEPEFINPTTLKKWATGDGHATKSKMVETCKKYGYAPTDDNVADACHLFFYYIRKHRL